MGYAGKLLRVNLSTGEIKTEQLDFALSRMFLGGRGLASKILYDEIDPKVDPLSPENKIIFAAGPLTGTNAPTGGRYMVITKGPLTGTIASSNSGGFFGAELKFAGYDMVIFEGKSDKPVYLSIHDEEVQLKDATQLWGKDVFETTDILANEFGDGKARVSCIGPAGENLVKFAGVMNDKHRAAGRTGVGAVMGSKNLKAIVVRGSGRPKPSSPDFMEVVRQKINIIKQNPVTGEGLPALGTKVLDNIINQYKKFPGIGF